jgi:hypothetical protein
LDLLLNIRQGPGADPFSGGHWLKRKRTAEVLLESARLSGKRQVFRPQFPRVSMTWRANSLESWVTGFLVLLKGICQEEAYPLLKGVVPRFFIEVGLVIENIRPVDLFGPFFGFYFFKGYGDNLLFTFGDFHDIFGYGLGQLFFLFFASSRMKFYNYMGH